MAEGRELQKTGTDNGEPDNNWQWCACSNPSKYILDKAKQKIGNMNKFHDVQARMTRDWH